MLKIMFERKKQEGALTSIQFNTTEGSFGKAWAIPMPLPKNCIIEVWIKMARGKKAS